MKTLIGRIISATTLVLIMASCTPALAPVETPQSQATIDVNPISTAAVQTYQVESTRKANLIPTATEVILPTNTPEPATATPTTELANTSPEITPTLWIPASGSSYPTITASLDTNCRSGPDQAFDVVGALRVGDTSEVHGKLNGGGWWYIKNVTNPDPKFCWVWAQTTVVNGDTSMIPIQQAPVAHPPKLTVGISVLPATSAVCPTTFVFTGTVTSDRATILIYQFVNGDGNLVKSGSLTFTDDGTQTVTLSKTYSDSTSNSMQFEITSPVTAHSAIAEFSLTCP
jgi:uncharacterized protein YraI